MDGLHSLPEYSLALAKFNGTNDWRCFKAVHLQRTHIKCPICEVLIDNSVERDSKKGRTKIRATIDHYRPRKRYDFLSNDHENFVLMCLDCNNHYKQNKFPLYPPGSDRAEQKAQPGV
jgi:hypothetical protein